MSPQVEKLNVAEFPLWGGRLIEASAGTGKTFTIAALYLRLLLEGCKQQPPLTVDQILVVTFTEAATQELKDRIRKRIKEARLAFQMGESDDALIQQLINAQSDSQQAADRLLTAERQMDEAAIFTINGFCMRMLQQHAFESGNLFSVTLCEDDWNLKLNAVKDYWRQRFYCLPMDIVATVMASWKTPEDLCRQIAGFLSDKPLAFYQPLTIDDLEQLHQENLQKITSFKQALSSQFSAFCDALKDDMANKRLCGRSYQTRYVTPWIETVESWLQEPTDNYHWPDKLSNFGAQKLEDKAKAELSLDVSLASEIQTFVDNPPDLSAALKQDAINQCRRIYRRQKQGLKQLTFDDQITSLADALAPENQGSEGLLSMMRAQYPVAMVDEFQDTDASQFQIFSRIYLDQGIQQDSSEASTQDPILSRLGLFMIGDPKQAIYAFRGGDIFTYMKARRSVEKHYSLGVNWRSSAPMVSAVNRLFQSTDSPFIYDSDIPFEPVSPSPVADSMEACLQGNKLPALSLMQIDPDIGVSKDSEYLDLMTQATANQIADLLNGIERDELVISKNGKTSTPQASDIAVLVRGFKQAQDIRKALSDRGIASTYSSDKSSVYEQPEALVILRLMRAMLQPENERLIKGAMAGYLFDWDAQQLHQLNQNEQRWEALVEQFRGYHDLWQHQGILPALNKIMFDHEVAQKLTAMQNGERNLTDFMHLTELLQNQSKSQESMYALLSWFEERIHNPNQGAREQQLRLESEQNLVRVVTYHKSKGLEYDFVFAPYLCHQSNRASSISVTHNQSGDLLLDVTGAANKQAEQESLAEEIRLLYVTLTRSVYACFIGVPVLKPGKTKKAAAKPYPLHVAKSGLGWLMRDTETAQVTEESICASLNDWLTSEAEILPVSLDSARHYEPVIKSVEKLTASCFKGHIERDWWITSYSRLASQLTQTSLVDQTPVLNGGDLQGVKTDAAMDASSDQAVQDELSNAQTDLKKPNNGLLKLHEFCIHNFPKGADAGTFLHLLFEEVAYQNIDEPETRTQIAELLQKDSISLKLFELSLPGYLIRNLSEDELEQQKQNVLDAWTDVLYQMMRDVLTQPLLQGTTYQGHDVPVLSNTQDHQRLVEMEFLLPVAGFNSSDLNKLLQQDPFSSRATKHLDFAGIQGMLKGFIDLVFEYQGRFYVLDWKSNWLGEQSTDYHSSAMAEAMLDHRYDLQYQLYTLALHRYLKTRVPDYDYDQHFGGIYYLFLRGVEGSQPTSSESTGVFYRRSEKHFIESLDQLFSQQLGSETPFAGSVDKAESSSRVDPSQERFDQFSEGQQGELF